MTMCKTRKGLPNIYPHMHIHETIEKLFQTYNLIILLKMKFILNDTTKFVYLKLAISVILFGTPFTLHFNCLFFEYSTALQYNRNIYTFACRHKKLDSTHAFRWKKKEFNWDRRDFFLHSIKWKKKKQLKVFTIHVWYSNKRRILVV